MAQSRAETLRRRSCYANSRLSQSPRFHWVRPHWRRPPPLPGVVGTAAGTAARVFVGGPVYYGGGYGYGGCYVRRLVPTPWGPRWHLINRCY